VFAVDGTLAQGGLMSRFTYGPSLSLTAVLRGHSRRPNKLHRTVSLSGSLHFLIIGNQQRSPLPALRRTEVLSASVLLSR